MPNSTLWVETADILLFFQFTTGLKRTLALQAYSECYFKDGITINYFQKSLLKFLDRVLAFQPSTVYLKGNMWSALQVLYCWNVHAFQSREHSLVCCSRTHHNQNFRIRDQEVKMKKIKRQIRAIRKESCESVFCQSAFKNNKSIEKKKLSAANWKPNKLQ